MNPEDEARIRAMLDEALRGGPKPHDTVRVFGLLKVPGAVQYSMRHFGFTVEKEIPPGRDESDMIRELCGKLGPLVLEFEPKTGPPTNSNTPKGAPAPSEPTPELTPEFLDTLGWKPFPTGGGEWVFFNTPGAEALGDELAKANGPVTFGNFRYRVTVGKTKDRDGNVIRFINRSPVQGAGSK